MSNWGSKIKDKVLQAAATSEIDKVVLKATYHNTKQPKEKHLRRLFLAVREGKIRQNEVIACLLRRLELVDWIVVLKTLVVVHRLMREAGDKFNAAIKHHHHAFHLAHFTDTSTTEAHAQSVLVRKYGQYIQEAAKFRRGIAVAEEEHGGSLKGLNVQQAFEHLPQLQSQLNALLNTKSCKDHINNGLAVAAFTLMLKDSFRIYRALNDALIVILEAYFSMNRTDAAKSLDMYKLFVRETDGTIHFFDICRRFVKTDLPDLQHAPATLVEALEQYLADLDAGRTPTIRGPPTAVGGNPQIQQLSLLDLREDTIADPVDSDSDDDKKQVNGNTTAFDPFGTAPTTNGGFNNNNGYNANANNGFNNAGAFNNNIAVNNNAGGFNSQTSGGFGGGSSAAPTFDPFNTGASQPVNNGATNNVAANAAQEQKLQALKAQLQFGAPPVAQQPAQVHTTYTTSSQPLAMNPFGGFTTQPQSQQQPQQGGGFGAFGQSQPQQQPQQQSLVDLFGSSTTAPSTASNNFFNQPAQQQPFGGGGSSISSSNGSGSGFVGLNTSTGYQSPPVQPMFKPTLASLDPFAAGTSRHDLFGGSSPQPQQTQQQQQQAFPTSNPFAASSNTGASTDLFGSPAAAAPQQDFFAGFGTTSSQPQQFNNNNANANPFALR